MIAVSEFLFWIMGGAVLANSPFIILWVGFWSVAMASSLLLVDIFKRKHFILAIFVATTIAIFAFVMAVGPPIKQLHMMSECRNQVVVVTTDNNVNLSLNVRECRYKKNYYGNFGDWQSREISLLEQIYENR
jgi:hypothetical protein